MDASPTMGATMKLIVGLGNPGIKYAETRHNIGFMVIDQLCRTTGCSLTHKFKGLFGTAALTNHPVMLLKPSTYMNISGESVLSVVNYYKIQVDELLIVHDELDFPFGKIRLKKDGGDGGHKGVGSIIAFLGDDGFSRLRIGIDKPLNRDVTNYVLDTFTKEERMQLDDVLHRAEAIIKTTVQYGIQAAMNEFH